MTSIQTGNLTVTTTAQPLAASSVACRKLLVTAASGNLVDVRLGTSAVSGSTGDLLPPGQQKIITPLNVAAVYAIVPTGTAEISWSVLE